MNKSIETIKNLRKSFLKTVEDLTIEQLNEIPAGFNNNIIWNMGHVIAAQQGICYKRSGLEIRLDENFFNAYKPDSKPDILVDFHGIERIKELLISSIYDLEQDYTNGVFSSYTAFTTRYGVTLNSIDSALDFLPFHEGFHMGYVLALKRAITK